MLQYNNGMLSIWLQYFKEGLPIKYPETTVCVYRSESDRIIHLEAFPPEPRKTDLINKYYYFQEQNGQV